MENRLRLTNATDRPDPAPRRPRRGPAGPARSHPWRMSDEARRAGREGIALARRELNRVRADLAATHGADAA